MTYKKQKIGFIATMILIMIGLAIAFISLPAPAEAATPKKNGIVYDEVRSRAWEPVINVVGQ